ncbi:hypothetical protein E2C01_083351 [Portunus trituberculatus]|uniref:Uncharacterized protein n=1 Tax=Portunus trituberculatus TaxID=210409 RepID=A0A5B7J6C5_PORTR|nr:hypothetical protein [Portunus trituberculatus]
MLPSHPSQNLMWRLDSHHHHHHHHHHYHYYLVVCCWSDVARWWIAVVPEPGSAQGKPDWLRTGRSGSTHSPPLPSLSIRLQAAAGESECRRQNIRCAPHDAPFHPNCTFSDL